jgi:glycogen synthase
VSGDFYRLGSRRGGSVGRSEVSSSESGSAYASKQGPMHEVRSAAAKDPPKRSCKELRILYALGPGEVVNTYRLWRDSDEGLSQTSLTFSGQFFDLCRQHGYRGYAVSSFSRRAFEHDSSIIAENRPKRLVGRGIWYHISQILYGLSIVSTAIRWRANFVLVDSGTTHWATLGALKLANVRVVGVLHNALWPAGHKPRRLTRRLILKTDAWFWRRVADAVISVSPECERQVRELAGSLSGRALQCRAQYRRSDFEAIGPPPPLGSGVLRIVFSGRVERDKGALDLVEIAVLVDAKYPGRTRFDVCGGGTALQELRELVESRGVEHLLHVHGRLDRPELLKIYARSHVFIVPTRSTFCEGMPLVCAEAVLSGRPIITSPVTNATDVLEGAIVLAETDDPSSYADKIGLLLEDVRLFDQLHKACPRLQEQFYDPRNSLTAAIAKITEAHETSGIDNGGLSIGG